MCERGSQQGEKWEGREGKQKDGQRHREGGRVTVNAQLSHLTGLSRWSASVSEERCCEPSLLPSTFDCC